MKTDVCDICGDDKGKTVELSDDYKTNEIVDVCWDCLNIINKKLLDIKLTSNKITISLTQRFINIFKKEKEQC